MAPAILIVGATGNTGRSVVEHLPNLLKDTNLSSYRILALTRSINSPSAQSLAKIDGVEVVEQNWVEITEDWLRERDIARIFIASHNEPTQFADEGQFLVNAMRAGVQYLVRISTTAANVRPDCGAYYPRSHWAIEKMLDQPEFKGMHFSSLQPNNFTTMMLGTVAAFVGEFRKTGKQPALSLVLNRDAPVGLIDPYDVGVFAAHLLALEDTAPHNGKRYVLNGPEDITGAEVVKIAEEYISEPVKDVQYMDMSMIDEIVKNYGGSKNLISSIKQAPVATWEGKAGTNTTSKEVPGIYAPKRTVRETFKAMVEG